LIEIKRPVRHHWALYVGKGYVIHVTAVGKAGAAWQDAEMVKVKKELLSKVVGNDEWRVNNKNDWCCTPLPAEEIIWRAECWIDKEVPYDVFGWECERFVKRLRYGGQVSE
ncbi:HRSL1 enzyme, partial [Origma solitaria]|nr:HRSL1 enzyme [Origma solitaria]